MATFEGSILDNLVSLAKSDQATVLAAAAPLGLKGVDLVVSLIDKENAVLGALATSFAPQIVTALGGEEAVLYAYLLGELEKYAAAHGG